MSDLNESGVTYIDISSPFEELSDIGSLRTDDHEHLMLHEMLEDPYVEVKENQEKDKIGSKPDKNGKRGEAKKSLKQLQLKEE
nr:hypothetical protein [Tanacetum cinerariifolium]